MNTLPFRSTVLHGLTTFAGAALLCASLAAAPAQTKPSKPSAPAPKPAAPAHTAAPAASHPASPAGASRGPSTPAAGGRGPTTPAGGARGPAATTPGGSRGPANASGASRGPSTGAPGGNRGSSTTPGGSRGPSNMNANSRGPAGNNAGRSGGMRASGAPARPNERVTRTAGGAEIHRAPNGRVNEVHARGMVISHGPGGSRTVVRERPGHVMVVSNHYGHGYIQRPYSYHGAEFYHRTYYYNGVAYGRFYRPYVWGGVAMNVYVPGYYFRPAFYGWAYNPWVAPIPYAWGWGGVPWYGYYGGWFTPYPVYASASLWLTDYLVSQTLQAAYAERAAELANQQAQFSEPMSPAVKQAIADEVRRQLALENAESATGVQTPPDPGSSGLARMLTDNATHVFVVAAGLDLTSNAGECSVTEGDVLQLSPGTPQNATAANLVVLASKGQDCRKGATVTVGVADLQEMQNHMRETLDQGLSDLQKKQGQGGLPAAPQAAVAAPTQTAYAAIAPPPDPNVGQELSQQSSEADRAEADALKESGPSDAGSTGGAPSAPPPPAAAPKTVTIGMTNEEVMAILGQPVQIADTGTKKMYVYKDLKIVFTNGKVSDIK